LQKLIDEAYTDFVDIVAQGRHLDVERVKQLADGRIYTGKQAKELDSQMNWESRRRCNAAARMAKSPARRAASNFATSQDSWTRSHRQSRRLGNERTCRLVRTETVGRVMYLYVAPVNL